MSSELILTLIGIAILDSLNPMLFISQFYLFTTPKPLARILAYIAGIALTNFTGGVLILLGLGAVLADALQTQNDFTYIIQLILGLLLIIFAWRMNPDAPGAEAKKPRALGAGYGFLLGVVVMGNELTSALPYFVALERIVEADLAAPEVFFSLLAYNLIFILPLIGFLLWFLAYQEKLRPQIERIQARVQRWTALAIKWGALIFGLLLVGDALRYFLA